jgi:hypothetical protein
MIFISFGFYNSANFRVTQTTLKTNTYSHKSHKPNYPFPLEMHGNSTHINLKSRLLNGRPCSILLSTYVISETPLFVYTVSTYTSTPKLGYMALSKHDTEKSKTSRIITIDPVEKDSLEYTPSLADLTSSFKKTCNLSKVRQPFPFFDLTQIIKFWNVRIH